MKDLLKNIYLRRFSTLVLLLAIGIAPAFAQFKLKVSGEIEKPLELSLADLKGMPRKEAVLLDKDGGKHVYEGVSLREILLKAGVPTGKDLRGEELSKFLLVKCSDGYQVLFSLAELDPSIADKNVILADKMDGKAIAENRGPLRIVAEGEKKPARSSYQVETLIIGKVKE
ncbi:molybdopterin-dependent oxidoreductase [Sphingobacterium cellulitidis]|uniref:molybdopterin-dependent oxidoreductase n=1 Tax=Sphingobacterium cellulitidis TaxID=1768011 RepID=UPI003C7A4CB7